MATYEALLDNRREGRAGVWRPQYASGKPVILDEAVDVEASDTNFTRVVFETADDPLSVHLMECALDSNEEIVEWQILEGNRYIVATQQITDEPLRQTDAGASGMAYQAGENIVIYFEPAHSWYGYYFEGVSPDGNAFESENVDGFESLEKALDAALDQAEEVASNEVK